MYTHVHVWSWVDLVWGSDVKFSRLTFGFVFIKKTVRRESAITLVLASFFHFGHILSGLGFYFFLFWNFILF